MRKILTVIFPIFLVGLLMAGCGDKQKNDKSASKQETSTAISFDLSKVEANINGGVVDIIEPKTFNIKISDSIHIGGWAYDAQKNMPPKAVVIVDNGKVLPITPQFSVERPDVAKALNNQNLVKTGWDVVFKSSDLGKGKHKLEFYAILESNKYAPLSYQGKGNNAEVEIVE